MSKKSDEVEKNIVVKSSANQHEGCWTKFTKFCSDNQLENPSIISDKTVKSIKLHLTFKCYTEGNGHKSAEGVRSGIRNHCSRILKADDGWSNVKFEGNPCDSNEAKDQITSIKKDKLNQGTMPTRAMAFSYRHLEMLVQAINLSTNVSNVIKCFMLATSTTAFYLWLRINELLNLESLSLISFLE